jgi:N-acetylmuramoyl-L-alanine amidase
MPGGGTPSEPGRPAGRAPRLRRSGIAVAVALIGAAVVISILLTRTAKTNATAAKRILPTIAPASTTTTSTPEARAVDPSAFSPGACVSYPPTAGDRHLTVFLDAGHGGLDPGAVGTTLSGETVYEADETLPVEMDAMAILRAEGFQVVVSRTADTSVVRLGPGDVTGRILTAQGSHDDVAARDVCANDAKADILIGIYFDSGDSAQNAGSLTGYDPDRPFAGDNLRLATLVQTDVLAAMNAKSWAIPDDGVISDEYLGSANSEADIAYGHLVLLGPAESGYFDTPSQMPGALVEPLFISDPFEATIAASDQGQQVIAHGLAEAVEQYFSGK